MSTGKMILCAFVLFVPLIGIDFAQCAPGDPPDRAETAAGETNGDLPINGIENVFIVVIDGVRNTEAFDDPTHRYIPHIWKALRPLGTIYTNCANLGATATTAGHAAITSGTVQPYLPNTLSAGYGDILRIQEEPSIFQYYRSQLNIPEDRTWIINGKGQFIGHTGISLNPQYGNSFAPRVSFTEIRNDLQIWAEVCRVMDTFHPSLVMINLGDVDAAGHTGDWNLYVNTISKADEIVFDIYRKIQSDPHYARRTVLIVTSDHGRHSDGVGTGFKDHGCSCEGCRRVPLLAVGPNIKAGAVVDVPACLADLAPTVGAMLGFEVRFRNSRVLREMFVEPPPLERDSLMNPCMAWGNGILHFAACMRIRDLLGILYLRSKDSGMTWEAPEVLSVAHLNLYPSIAADGDCVAVVWNEIGGDCVCRVAGRESTDGGATWSPRFTMSGSQYYQYNLFPDACYDNGMLNIVWTEPRMGGSAVNLVQVSDQTVVGSDVFVEEMAGRPRCAATPEGVDVVFQRMDRQNKNFDVYHCRFANGKWQTPTPLCTTPGESLRPDIAVDTDGIHVAWAELDDGSFHVMVKNSSDGSTWDSGRYVSMTDEGAWHPRLAPSGKGLIAVWEDYSAVTGGRPVITLSHSLDGGITWPQPVDITQGTFDSVFPALTVDSSDLMHLVWLKSPWPTWIEYVHTQL